jgi:hypothetical protein
MKKIGSLIIANCLVFASLFAQQVSGSVKDQQGKELPNSTVSLLHAKDSSVVKLAASNNNGQFSFNAIQPGRYVINVSHVGYQPVYSSPFDFSGSGE